MEGNGICSAAFCESAALHKPSQAHCVRQLPRRGSFISANWQMPKSSPFGGAGTPLGVTERVQPAEGQQETFPQRRAFAESGAATAVFRYDPTCENATPERPQTLRCSEI